MCESQIVVTNTSKVELTYRCASIEQLGDNVYVGCPIVENPTGTISQFSSETVKFKFIAGTPDKFSKSFKVLIYSLSFTSLFFWEKNSIVTTAILHKK